MRRFLLVTAVAVLAAAVFVFVTAPPASRALAVYGDGTVRGIVHVHTNRSDGRSSPEEVAAAAARAGLNFVVFTDHGDGTRQPDPPVYRSGVLCLDGIEISTTGGHYAVLDMPVSPYPLGGEARDVVEDVHRLGGFGIAAHPDSPKSDLRWREWGVPFDAIELLNLDTGWRLLVAERSAKARWRLFTAVTDYAFRSPEVMASLIQPTGALANWDAITHRRKVVAIAGADAHGKIDTGSDRFSLPWPSYTSTFRVMSVHVAPNAKLTGDAASDAALIARAIRAGHLYVAVDAVGKPPAFQFTATNTHGTVSQGDELEVGGPIALHIRSNAPPDFTTIVRDGVKVLASSRDVGDSTVHVKEEPAVYWVEIVGDGTPPITWLRSNPIYVRGPEAEARRFDRPPSQVSRPIFDGSANGWSIVHDTDSLAAVDIGRRVGGTELRVRYGLDGTTPLGRFAGVSYETPSGIVGFDRLTFTGRADQPMRISVQLRTNGGERWRRSVFVDTTSQDRTVYFDDLTPVDAYTFRPQLNQIRQVVFVIDTTNTKPGASGRLWLEKAALEGR